MGGVVNIITKRRQDEGFESSLLTSYGSNSTIHSLLRHGGKIGAFDYYGTYDRKQTDGHRPNSAYEADFGSLRLGYQLDEVWRAELSGQFFRARARAPGGVTAPYHDDVMNTNAGPECKPAGQWDNGTAFPSPYNNSAPTEPHAEHGDYWYSDDRTTGTLTKALTLYDDDPFATSSPFGHDYSTSGPNRARPGSVMRRQAMAPARNSWTSAPTAPTTTTFLLSMN